MSHHTTTTAIARIALLAGVLLAILLLPTRAYQPAHAQEATTLTETIEYAENRTDEVVSYAAIDPEKDTITWTLGGTHARVFSTPPSGTEMNLTFKSQPDFEDGTGSDTGNNTYTVTVTARDETNELPAEWTLTINVTNVDEAGSIMLSTLQPLEKVPFTAKLTDPDGEVGASLPLTLTGDDPKNDLTAEATWQWAKSTSSTGPWTDITGATASSYTPVKADVGSYLRASVKYNDGQGGPGKTKTATPAVSANLVRKNLVNDPPEFQDDEGNSTDIAVRSVPENSPAGTAVGAPVVAYDDDGDVLTYELVDGNLNSPGDDEELFTIDRGTGQIRVKSGTNINKEDTGNPDDLYAVTVRAKDPSDDPPGNPSRDTVEVTINVTNVNERPELADETSAANLTAKTLNERRSTDPNNQSPAYTEIVSTYTATDADDDDSDTDTKTLSWSLSGTDRGALAALEIVPAEGNDNLATLQFKSASPADYEARSDKVYDVTVVVTDSDGATDSRDVAVTIANVDEAGTVTLPHTHAEVGKSITAKLTDPDGGIRNQSWRWSSNATTSLSTSATYRPKAYDATKTLTVTVIYTDALGGNETANQTIDVRPRDTTDVNPDFQVSRLTRSVDENSPAGTNVGAAVTAVDNGGDTNNDDPLIYKLSGSDARYFDIEERGNNKGQISVAAGTNLDYEKKKTYTVTVTAIDPSGSSDNVTVTINVTDVAESPSTIQGSTEISRPENTSVTTVLGTYTTTDDDDKSRNKQPVWSVSDTANFAIGNTSSDRGQLTFKRVLSYEDPPGASTGDRLEVRNTYTVTVTATDNGNVGNDGNFNPASRLATSTTVTVKVTNVDETGSLTFDTLQPLEKQSLRATLTDPDGRVPDNGIVVFPIVSDLTSHATTTWKWDRSKDGSTNWTDIVAATTINTNIATNIRTPEAADVGYYLRATATYHDGHGAGKTISVVSNNRVAKNLVNDKPIFVHTEGNVYTDNDGAIVNNPTVTVGQEINADQLRLLREVPENSSARTAVGAPVVAYDEDGDVLTYELGTTGDNLLFTIDPGTGQIRVKSGTNIDKEDSNNRDDLYTVTVTAKDPSRLSDEITVTIKVTNVDELPKLADTTNTANLTAKTLNERRSTDPDNQSPAYTAVVSTYTATDPDDDDDAAKNLSWSLSGTDKDALAALEIVPTAGNDNQATLRFKNTSPADYEARNDKVYDVTVVVTDTDGMTDSRDVEVTITNVEEAGTVTLSHTHAEVGKSIRATLTDPDGGVRSQSWAWTRPATTTVLSRSASYTPKTSDVGETLTVTVTYTDALGGGKIASITMANMVSAKENPNVKPDFQVDGTSVTRLTRYVNENSPAGTSVADDQGDASPVTAVDGGGGLIYKLSGSDARYFDIEERGDNKGWISVAAGTNLDYETKKKYTVTVRAEDPSGDSDTVTVDINVTDVNEPPTVVKKSLVITGPGTFDYPEDETNRQVATYRAVGPDGTRRWSKSGDDAGDFQLSSAGALSFSSQPNYELPADDDTDNVYEVTLQATVGDITDTYDVTVTVTNAEEAGTVTLSPTTRPRVGTEITAALTDPDSVTSANTTGSITTGVTWQWSKATTTSSTWSDISGATTASYTPAEDDADNFLRATARYAAGQSAVATTTQTVLALTATPNDGTVSVSPAQPVVGTAVTARLTDPDGSPTGLTWQWSWATTATAATSSWTNIPGATSASYTPVAADDGRYLRATASYSDAVDGAGQTAFGTSANAVTTVVAVDEYDRNADGRIDSTEVLEAVADYFAGRLSQARVLQVVALYFAGLPPTS